MHNIVCIYTHILYQIYLHFVSRSLLHNGNRRVASPFFWVVVFNLPPKRHPRGHRGWPVRQRHVSGLRFSPLTMQRPLCHSVPFSWSHAWRRGGKTAGVFYGHSEALNAGFLLGDLKKSPTGAREKNKKVYIY